MNFSASRTDRIPPVAREGAEAAESAEAAELSGRWSDIPAPTEAELDLAADAAWATEMGLLDLAWPDDLSDEEAWLVSHDSASPAIDDAPERPVDPRTLADERLRRLEAVAEERRRATAEEYRLIALILSEATVTPEPWVGADPTLDASWNDVRRRRVAAVRRDRIDLAERAAVAEIAVRLRLSEQTVRVRAAHARVLQERCPSSWAGFVDGRTSERHAVETARLSATLPDDDAGSWAAFDDGAADRASRLTPARFAVAARALRERVHSESLEARHRRALRDRGVWLTAELDGMATLNALLPADRAHAALARLDQVARHLVAAPDEDRTLAQLRADALADLLTSDLERARVAEPGSQNPEADAKMRARVAEPPSRNPDADDEMRARVADAPEPPARHITSHPPSRGSAEQHRGSSPPDSSTPSPTGRVATAVPRVTASVVVTVPALTLLGASDEPAVLDGYGPIDLDTARQLAGGAASWTRLLTHPLTGAPLALDRTSYRVTATLRRWLGITRPTCIFPGCGRSARSCDLDHLVAWADGGTTDDDNLEPECRHHHRLRHGSEWMPIRDDATGEVHWRSPLGHVVDVDPPPF
ncbi:DUF222 domain-containing protein [Microbacterium sp.]|uniref:HNH endonuclease signature motif containing protein n=1 Tax=Microbacterium sp. TaxID=51671 RepID=UPI00391B3673